MIPKLAVIVIAERVSLLMFLIAILGSVSDRET